jgi:23S rRNA pseudouridine2605 synthase
MAQRVQKILSQWGIASRRQAEQMILDGRVRLNGNLVQLGQKVDLKCDRLEVDGKPIQKSDRPKHIYLLLNKPKGVLSTCYDPQNRPTVLDLLPPHLKDGTGIHPIGRLDAKSTGALILTNDGDLTLTLTHPRYHLPKVYYVRLQGHFSNALIKQWSEGIILEGEKTLPAEIILISRSKEETELEIILTEGRNRQIRKIAEQLGFKVLQLHRFAIGKIKLESEKGQTLPKGKYRILTPKELKTLTKINPLTSN